MRNFQLYFYKSLVILCIAAFLQVTVIAQKTFDTEAYRPQYHFSPKEHWMNDPNGMVYYKGEYHLFYQYYPGATVWGPMHWGHAISKDLVRWQHLPVALYPDSLGYIFSGSVVVDKNNTSGFKKGPESPLVAIYTYHDMAGEKAGKIDFQTQGIAYSLDKGRTWKKYAKNPVIKNPGIKDFRDPKVIWHEASKKWIMTLAVADHVRFYQSTNLKDWTLGGSFGKTEGNHGGVWECPDLFKLSTKDGKDSKWVLLVSVGTGAPNGGSGTQYFIGNFNGSVFTNDAPKETTQWLDYGKDNYAGVTWHNNPGKRKIFLGWMSNWQYAQTVPTEKWRSAMTIPREISLEKNTGHYQLISTPVKELEQLRKKIQPTLLELNTSYPIHLQELLLQFDLAKAGKEDVGIVLENNQNEKLTIGYHPGKKQFYIDRTGLSDNQFSKDYAGIHLAPRISENEILKMHVFIDQSSVEVFADDGSVVMTEIFFSKQGLNKLTLLPKKEVGAALIDGKMFDLKTIWR